jgi:hypothetical protein
LESSPRFAASLRSDEMRPAPALYEAKANSALWGRRPDRRFGEPGGGRELRNGRTPSAWIDLVPSHGNPGDLLVQPAGHERVKQNLEPFAVNDER